MRKRCQILLLPLNAQLVLAPPRRVVSTLNVRPCPVVPLIRFACADVANVPTLPPLRRYAWAGLLVLILAAAVRNVPHLAPGAFNWAESGNTAAALVEHRGFSDPFAGGTGATAWVPPVFVWVVAAAFAVAGVKSAGAAFLLLVFTILMLAGAHAWLIAALPPHATWMRRATSFAFLALAIFLPLSPLTILSEAPLQVFLSALLLWAAVGHADRPRAATAAALITVAVLGPLAHAGLALAVAFVFAGLFLRGPREGRRALLVAGTAGALAVGAWTARNAAALGRFVPLKSNLWFELHLANVASPDGMPRAGTVMRQMPFFNADEFERYARLGELRYVESFRAPALAALREEPGRFARNVLRRLANALVYCQLSDGSIVTHTRFSPSDTARLAQSGHLLPYAGMALASWTRIDAAPSNTHTLFGSLGLDDFPGVWRDWAEKHEAYRARHYSVGGLLVGFLLAGVPTLAWLATALARRGRMPPFARWSLVITLGMLAPFVLVNHSARHQAPLLALHAVALGACCQSWIDRLRARAADASTER